MDTLSERNVKDLNWLTLILITLGFWLSASCLIDFVLLPSLSVSGMMSQSGFASAGFLLFGIFNHLELLFAALILSGVLVFRRHHIFSHSKENVALGFAGILFLISLCYTYFLTPQMGGLGLQLNLFRAFDPMNSSMMAYHWSYWGLELLKLIIGVTLWRWCYQNVFTVDKAA
jgi:hypothetical protein